MKTVMKKLFSLMLVAALLVSAVPFQASAARFGDRFNDEDRFTGFEHFTGRNETTGEEKTTNEDESAIDGQMDGSDVDLGDMDAVRATVELYYQYGEDASTQTSLGSEVITEGSTTVRGLFNALSSKPEGTLVQVNIWGGDGDEGNQGDWQENLDLHVYNGQHVKFIMEKDEPAEPVTGTVQLYYQVGKNGQETYIGTATVTNGVTTAQMLYNNWGGIQKHTFKMVNIWGTDATVDGLVENRGDWNTYLNVNVYAGQNVKFILELDKVDPTPKPNPPHHRLHDVWLYIYTNNNMKTPAKRVHLSEYTRIVNDGIVTKNEALSVIDDYYHPEHRKRDFGWDGMYEMIATRHMDQSFAWRTATLLDEITGLNESRQNNEMIIKVHVTGAVAYSSDSGSGSSGSADNTNPKTGDMIFMPAAILGVSAGALAVLFFLNKKRAM